MKSKNKKILLLGKEGMLGHVVYRHLNEQGYDIKGTDHLELDVTEIDDMSIKIIEFKPDIIINCTGLLNNCKDIHKFAKVNILAPRFLEYFVKNENIKFIHVSTNCFVPTTKIMTSKGYKQIKDVKQGDLVYTHKGRLKKVTGCLKRHYSGKIVKIKFCGNQVIRCSPEHPFYAFHDNEIKWVFASDFNTHKTKINSRLTSPLIDRQLNNPKLSIDLFNYLTDSDKKKNLAYEKIIEHHIKRYRNGILKYGTLDELSRKYQINKKLIFSWITEKRIPRLAKDLRDIQLNKDNLWFLGIFMAEGSVSIRKKGYEIQVSFGDEPQLVKKTKEVLSKLKVNYYEYYPKNQKGVQIRFNSKTLQTFLLKEFYINGHKSKNKKIPSFIFNLTRKQIISFLHGYLDGDGCFYKDSFVTVSTVSPYLKQDLKFLLQIIGIFPSEYTNKNPNKIICGRKIHSNTAYRITIKKDDIKYLREKPDFYCKTISVNEYSLEDYNGELYNLEVKDDNSYLAEGISVHNCVFKDIGKHKEDDAPNADDWYGMSKAFSEVNGENCLTIRTSITGPELNPNGVGLFHWFVNCKDKEVSGFKNAYWNGVTTLELAKFIDECIKKKREGIINYYTYYESNKWEVLNVINSVYGLKKKIVPSYKSSIHSSLLKGEFFTKKTYTQQFEELKEWYDG